MTHPRPWWYRLALRVCPSRCREIPEPRRPGSVLLRQVAIVRRHVYLQGFASGESLDWMHSHAWRRIIVLGVWGWIAERRFGRERSRIKRAPYLTVMDDSTIHQVIGATAGHTSILFGFGRTAERRYWRADARGRSWREHTIAGTVREL